MSEPTQTPPWEKYDARYRAFREREDIPVHEGLYIEDIRTVAVDDWERTGDHGAFVDLFGMEGMCDIHLGEILPGERLRPQRHLHEKLVFVVQGNGIISLRTDERSRTFEWGPGALFYLPRNTEYVHTNSDPERSVRLLAVTPLSLLYTLLQDDEAIWEIERYDQWPPSATARSTSARPNCWRGQPTRAPTGTLTSFRTPQRSTN